ncbi:lanthionine synthetase C family protein [Aquimarina gracilis]|uniref:Lanthionine synthetase C family protein n=1 Tax=Aquimarina gracilis TaxID=874422 RepID=A0ABU5ZZN2_9FLAO|nr:lanthionine synthetase C family protein [Aquimarina gracilis]MEB3347280.1 lanthionine synthetase C family protein [Aquimarina gracilis]
MLDRSLLEKKLKEIYDILKDIDVQNEHHGVLAGISGISLFQFYYSKLIEEEEPADHGVDLITKTIQGINEGYTFPTFCTGIAGAGWVIELLNEEEFIDIDNDELLEDLDEFLFRSMKENMKDGNYDFLHGAIGYGYYFLKRYRNTVSADLKNRYKEYLSYLISALKDTSESSDQGTYWKTTLSKEDDLIGVNLSLSHGLSSIVNFLSRVYAYEDFKNEVRDLLVDTVRYIRNQKNDDLGLASLYPSWIHEGMEKNSKSRLAWCYGDLGIGLSLWQAGKALDNTAYKEEAVKTIKHATKRKDLVEAGIKDAGLCHGSFGIAAIFDRMHKETEDPVFKETADYWMQQALKMDKHQGNAGYLQWRGDLEEWKEESNVLEGIAGIGLVLISFLATFDTKWDECLMIG